MADAPRSSRRSDLTVRVLSAAVMLLAGFSALLFDLHTRWVLITLLLSVGAWELSRLVSRKLASPTLAWLPAVSVFALCLPRFPGWSAPVLWSWFVAVLTLAALIAFAFRRLGVTVIAPWIAFNAFIVAYLGIWGAKVFDLTDPWTGWSGIAPLVFTVLCIAAADSGAYFTGRAIGKRKLAPGISAGKTWEGVFGGVAASVLLAGLLSRYAALGLAQALVLGAVLAACSVTGDLFISVFKRWANAKDTSNLIPGHGGVMDRFDALIFAAPFAWIGFLILG
jgi:phosphatidate cytidylyltransferase